MMRRATGEDSASVLAQPLHVADKGRPRPQAAGGRRIDPRPHRPRDPRSADGRSGREDRHVHEAPCAARNDIRPRATGRLYVSRRITRLASPRSASEHGHEGVCRHAQDPHGHREGRGRGRHQAAGICEPRKRGGRPVGRRQGANSNRGAMHANRCRTPTCCADSTCPSSCQCAK